MDDAGWSCTHRRSHHVSPQCTASRTAWTTCSTTFFIQREPSADADNDRAISSWPAPAWSTTFARLRADRLSITSSARGTRWSRILDAGTRRTGAAAPRHRQRHDQHLPGALTSTPSSYFRRLWCLVKAVPADRARWSASASSWRDRPAQALRRDQRATRCCWQGQVETCRGRAGWPMGPLVVKDAPQIGR